MEKDFTYSIRIRLCAGEKFFGPGTVTLLLNVDKTHSLLAASRLMSLSYSKATAMIKNAEKHLGFNLLISRTGGESGGGSELTPGARAIISLFSDFTLGVQAGADRLFKTLKEEAQKLPPMV
jgi:molybdate transport system regulatory protein